VSAVILTLLAAGSVQADDTSGSERQVPGVSQARLGQDGRWWALTNAGGIVELPLDDPL